jgi:hypothetical protein
VVSGLLDTNSHNAIATGILGTVIGEIGLADLNIIDAIYINAVPTSGPSTSYTGATRRRELVACLDPVAADIWSVKNILVPAFIANGYSPPWPTPSADPDDPNSTFRHYLDHSMSEILAAGDTVTNNLSQIDAFAGNGRAGDFDEDADIDSLDYTRFVACYTGPGGGPVGPECAAADFDSDGDVDCNDWLNFQFVWTGPGSLPAFTLCTAGVNPGGGGRGEGDGADGDGVGGGGDQPGTAPAASLRGASPNPTKQAALISFSLAVPARVRLTVADVKGRAVRTLVDGTRPAGDYSVGWDATDDRGEGVVAGVYFYRLETPGFSDTKKIVISK